LDSILLSRRRWVGGGYLVPHVPQILVEPAFHSLLQNFHGRSHGADNAPSDDSFGELEMVEAEQLHAFVEVEHALGNIVQAKEFFVTAVEFAGGEAGTAELLVKRVAEARADVEQREESRRVEAAAVSEAGANQVVVVGSNSLQNVQQADGRIEQRNGATDQAPGVAIVGALERFEAAAEFESRSLHEQLRALVHNQEGHLVFVQQFFGRLLQGEELVSAQIALVVGRSFARQNRFCEFVAMCHWEPISPWCK